MVQSCLRVVVWGGRQPVGIHLHTGVQGHTVASCLATHHNRIERTLLPKISQLYLAEQLENVPFT